MNLKSTLDCIFFTFRRWKCYKLEIKLRSENRY